ncbi:hypothetical protein LP7551_02113 [Roseibium album]|nr:hypothetical protein LP7551_02113 [Roseibium album]
MGPGCDDHDTCAGRRQRAKHWLELLQGILLNSSLVEQRLTDTSKALDEVSFSDRTRLTNSYGICKCSNVHDHFTAQKLRIFPMR